MTPLEQFLQRAEALLARVEAVLPPTPPAANDWHSAFAFRWRKRGSAGYLAPVRHAGASTLDDLHHVGPQRRQFVHGRPANSVLLTGARATGKSSVVKSCVNQYAGDGLRLIEVDKVDLADL